MPNGLLKSDISNGNICHIFDNICQKCTFFKDNLVILSHHFVFFSSAAGLYLMVSSRCFYVPLSDLFYCILLLPK